MAAHVPGAAVSVSSSVTRSPSRSAPTGTGSPPAPAQPPRRPPGRARTRDHGGSGAELHREVLHQLSRSVYCRMLTPREITRIEMISALTLSTPMSSLARQVSGIVSVGQNAVELVSDT